MTTAAFVPFIAGATVAVNIRASGCEVRL